MVHRHRCSSPTDLHRSASLSARVDVDLNVTPAWQPSACVTQEHTPALARQQRAGVPEEGGHTRNDTSASDAVEARAARAVSTAELCLGAADCKQPGLVRQRHLCTREQHRSGKGRKAHPRTWLSWWGRCCCRRGQRRRRRRSHQCSMVHRHRCSSPTDLNSSAPLSVRVDWLERR